MSVQWGFSSEDQGFLIPTKAVSGQMHNAHIKGLSWLVEGLQDIHDQNYSWEQDHPLRCVLGTDRWHRFSIQRTLLELVRLPQFLFCVEKLQEDTFEWPPLKQQWDGGLKRNMNGLSQMPVKYYMR